MSILFAATHPQRTRALILQGAFACIMRSPDNPGGIPEDAYKVFLDRLVARWGEDEALLAWVPSLRDDPRGRDGFERFVRHGQSPGGARALMNMYRGIDVRDALGSIRVPTLVMHRRGDLIVRAGAGAAGRGARSRARDTWSWEDRTTCRGPRTPRRCSARSRSSSRAHARAPEPDRVLATVLFTDIVDSTRLRRRRSATGAGATCSTATTAWCAASVERHRGRVVKTTGDGVAGGVRRAARGDPRGDRESRDGRHAARARGARRPAHRRVRAARRRRRRHGGPHRGARGGQRRRRRDPRLAHGHRPRRGLRALFEDRGEHELKGVPGTWQLFAVAA